MVKLPALPNPDKALSLFDTASNLIDRGLSVIDKVSSKLDRFAESPQKEAPKTPETTRTTARALETAPGASGEASSITDKATLKYQLNKLRAGLRQLEIHLTERCRID